LRWPFPWLTPKKLAAKTVAVRDFLNNVVILDEVPSQKKPQMGGLCAI
jgi:hypothetical protein